MLQINHNYSHKSEWFYEFSKEIDATVLNKKISIFPSNIAQGLSYNLFLMEGISIILLDAVFTNDIEIKRLKSDDDLYILHFDLSDSINEINVNNLTKKISKTKFESGFSVFHTSISSTFKPIKNQRVYALRILIERQKLTAFLNKKAPSLKEIEKKILFYNHLNASSKVLINSLKEKSVFDIGYDLYIKGISLKLLANFIETYSQPEKDEIRKIDLESVAYTREYMKLNLYETFPGILHLSKSARMSPTRYKTLFRKIYNDTPHNFFNNQRVILINQLLQSGRFSSVNEAFRLFNNSKAYIMNKYINYYGRNPSIDLKTR